MLFFYKFFQYFISMNEFLSFFLFQTQCTIMFMIVEMSRLSELKLLVWFESHWVYLVNAVISRCSFFPKIHNSFHTNNPRPLFWHISSAERKIMIFRINKKATGNEFIYFFELTCDAEYIIEIYSLCYFFALLIFKCKYVIDGDHYPSLAPFFHESWSFVKKALSHFIILYFLLDLVVLHYCL